MMSGLRRYAKYLISSPKLYRIYYRPEGPSPSDPRYQHQQPTSHSPYTPSLLESVTDTALTYVLPLTLFISLYKRNVSYVQVCVLLYVLSRLLRSVSRLRNPTYWKFLTILEKATQAPNDSESLELLRTYDFEFSFFPVSHECRVSVDEYASREATIRRGTGWLMYCASYAVAHSFGIRLIYPGLLLGSVLRAVLEDGRAKLVVEKRGVRVKIRVGGTTSTGPSNQRDGPQQQQCLVDIDAMVFDKRGSTGGGRSNGDILAICCEGNAGFYEIGMLGGALSEGYSVLGWNHPGFGGSTGTPYPTTELTAALGVMDYAVNVLGFKESEIMVYGWSIGGFPATYVARTFPNIRGLLLDATFDTLLPLAIPRMPEFMSPLVVSTILNHVNLDNTANLVGYSGPIRLVRRVDDEIIADPPGVLKANRGNQLLIDVVLRVYEDARAASLGERERDALVQLLTEWVERPHDEDPESMDPSSRKGPVVTPLDSLSGDVVKVVGGGGASSIVDRQAVIDIASSILRDYKSTHCTPLPKEFYRIRRA